MRPSTSSGKGPGSRLGVAVLWLLIWQGCYWLVGRDLLLSSPAAVAVRLAELGATAQFWQIILRSIVRICLGFGLGVAVGTVLGVWSALWAPAYRLLELPMGIIKATPVSSFVILALMWITGRNLSTFIAFLMVLPLIWTNVHQGMLSTDPKLLEMARVFNLPRGTVLRAIYLPAVLPYFLSGCRVAMGFAWKSGVAGEVIATPKGVIGTQLYNAKIYLETVDLFAWTAVVILLSVWIEKMLTAGLSALAARLGRQLPEEVQP